MRVQHQHPGGAGRAPVGDVVVGETPCLVGVAHLGRRSTAAPLLAHQAELVTGGLQDLRDRPRHAGPVVRRLTVHEQHCRPADRDVQAVGPVPHPALADLGGAQDRLMGRLVGPLVPGPPLLLVDAAVHRQCPDGLDHIHCAGPEAVEVAGEQGVGTAQFARAALRAVDVIGCHVGDLELTLFHRDDVRVKGGRRPGLVPGDLHDRTDFAAELVPGGEAVVGRVAPLRHELTRPGVGELQRHRAGDLVGKRLQRRVVPAHPGRERLGQRVGTRVGVRFGLGHGDLPGGGFGGCDG